MSANAPTLGERMRVPTTASYEWDPSLIPLQKENKLTVVHWCPGRPTGQLTMRSLCPFQSNHLKGQT
ncbi:hypothetical protein ACOMHN_036622 [Nucella lapillus]